MRPFVEPIRQGVRARLATIAGRRPRAASSAPGRLADDFQQEVAFFESSPSFVREPEGGVAERFIRTLKENLLWVRSFDTGAIDERSAWPYSSSRTWQWMLEKYHYQSPARRDFVGLDAAASNTVKPLSKNVQARRRVGAMVAGTPALQTRAVRRVVSADARASVVSRRPVCVDGPVSTIQADAELQNRIRAPTRQHTPARSAPPIRKDEAALRPWTGALVDGVGPPPPVRSVSGASGCLAPLHLNGPGRAVDHRGLRGGCSQERPEGV